MSDHFTRRDFLAGFACAGIAVPVWARLPSPTRHLLTGVNLAADPAQHVRPFDLRNVRLSAGPWLSALETNRKYMLQLDPDRLLHMFRLTAGLPSTAEP